MTDYPKDDDKTIYIAGDFGKTNLAELLMKIEEKWPGVRFEDVSISSEYRHVNAIGYDLYDPTDYINYIIITLNK